ncbi:MAG: type I phosphomannose isomerase catalytic subunit [Planctomycetota bacterium]
MHPPDAKPYPLRFHPLLKQTIWGGRRLGEKLGKPLGASDDYAESWELVDHRSDQSVVQNGELEGLSLQELIRRASPWLLGKQAGGSDSDDHTSFPLLLKYLDCNRVLSVQVHPDDEYGAQMTPPDLGKTEAWFVVDADPESVIYAGLKTGVDRATLAEAVEAGQTEQVLHTFHPSPGDCVFIPAGTVHALGAGLLIAEIQQSSNTTFRLFDWNRLGSDGQARPLHIQQSLDVTDFSRGPVHPSVTDRSAEGWQSLVNCDKFCLRALCQGVGSIGGDGQFHILTVPIGSALIREPGGQQEQLLQVGETVLLPAAMEACEVVPSENAVVLAMAGPR